MCEEVVRPVKCGGVGFCDMHGYPVRCVWRVCGRGMRVCVEGGGPVRCVCVEDVEDVWREVGL